MRIACIDNSGHGAEEYANTFGGRVWERNEDGEIVRPHWNNLPAAALVELHPRDATGARLTCWTCSGEGSRTEEWTPAAHGRGAELRETECPTCRGAGGWPITWYEVEDA